MAEISLGLSFDDVLLVPAMSSVLPGEADLSTHVTAGIPLFLPVVSAAMDTVSEHDLAIALAREGGMGVIHRACPIDEQVTMVSRVKRSENAVILKPLTVRKEDYRRSRARNHGEKRLFRVSRDRCGRASRRHGHRARRPLSGAAGCQGGRRDDAAGKNSSPRRPPPAWRRPAASSIKTGSRNCRWFIRTAVWRA